MQASLSVYHSNGKVPKDFDRNSAATYTNTGMQNARSLVDRVVRDGAASVNVPLGVGPLYKLDLNKPKPHYELVKGAADEFVTDLAIEFATHGLTGYVVLGLTDGYHYVRVTSGISPAAIAARQQREAEHAAKWAKLRNRLDK
jgi:hypothetical protein